MATSHANARLYRPSSVFGRFRDPTALFKAGRLLRLLGGIQTGLSPRLSVNPVNSASGFAAPAVNFPGSRRERLALAL